MTETPDRPPTALPTARPVSVLSYAQIDVDARYPTIAMRRPDAAVDLTIVAVILAGFSVLSVCSGLPLYLAELIPRGGIFLWVIANGMLSMAIVSLVLVGRRQSAGSIGLNRASLPVVVLGTIAAIPLCFAMGSISNILVTLLSGTSFEALVAERAEFLGEVSDIPVAWILPISLFVGIYEEILFRGFVLSRLCSLFRSRGAPIVLTSVLFGLLHFEQGLVGMCQTGVVGAVLAIVVTYTRTIWPAILAHAGIDALSLLMSVLLRDTMQTFLEQATTAPAG